MDLTNALLRSEKNDKYIADELLPSLLEAAVSRQSPSALQLLGTTMLVSCVRYPQQVHPLRTLFEPKYMFDQVFVLDGNNGLWQTEGEEKLTEIPELLLDGRSKHLLRIGVEVSKREGCGCGAHPKSINDEPDKAPMSRIARIAPRRLRKSGRQKPCMIPSVQLWHRIGLLSAACQQDSPNAKTIIERLDQVCLLLSARWELSQSVWWPLETPPFEVWSRYRAVFMLSLARAMLDRIARYQKDGLKNNAPENPITINDLVEATFDMLKFWPNVGSQLEPPNDRDRFLGQVLGHKPGSYATDLADLHKEVLSPFFGAELSAYLTNLVKKIRDARSRQADEGMWNSCQKELDTWINNQNEAKIALEHIVFGAIAKAIRFELNQNSS